MISDERTTAVHMISPLTILMFAAFGLALGTAVVLKPTAVILAIILAAAVFLVARDMKYGAVVLALVVPLQQIGAFEVLGYTLKPSHIIALIMIVSLLIIFMTTGRTRLWLTPMDLPYAMFLLAAIVSMGAAINLTRSLAILAWAAVAYSIYFVFSRTVSDEQRLRSVMQAFFVSAVIVAIFGIYQFVASYTGLPTWLRDVYIGTSAYLTRVHSTFLEPLHFANYLVVAIPLLLGYVLYGQERGYRFISWMGILLVLTALAMTISRGGYLALAFSLGVFWLFSLHKSRSVALWKILTASVIILAILAVTITIVGVPDIVKETIVGGSAIRAGSSMTRVMLIQDTLRMFAVSPFVGIGIGNFGPYYNMLTFSDSTGVADFRQANNIIFEVLAETGIIGLTFFLLTGIAYVWMLWVALIKARSRLTYSLAVGAAAASAGVALQLLTYTPMYGEWVWFLVGLTAALWKMAVSSNGSGGGNGVHP